MVSLFTSGNFRIFRIKLSRFFPSDSRAIFIYIKAIIIENSLGFPHGCSEGKKLSKIFLNAIITHKILVDFSKFVDDDSSFSKALRDDWPIPLMLEAFSRVYPMAFLAILSLLPIFIATPPFSVSQNIIPYNSA